MSSIVLSREKHTYGYIIISTSDNVDNLDIVVEYHDAVAYGTFTRKQRDYWVPVFLNHEFHSNVFLNDTEIAKIYNYYISITPVETYFDDDDECHCTCCRGECPGNA